MSGSLSSGKNNPITMPTIDPIDVVVTPNTSGMSDFLWYNHFPERRHPLKDYLPDFTLQVEESLELGR
jgi:hypothetical protein